MSARRSDLPGAISCRHVQAACARGAAGGRGDRLGGVGSTAPAGRLHDQQRHRRHHARHPAGELDAGSADHALPVRGAGAPRRLHRRVRPGARGGPALGNLARRAGLHIPPSGRRAMVQRRGGDGPGLRLLVAAGAAAGHRGGLRGVLLDDQGRARVLRLARERAGPVRSERGVGGRTVGADTGEVQRPGRRQGTRQPNTPRRTRGPRAVLPRHRGVPGLLPGVPAAAAAVRAGGPEVGASQERAGLDQAAAPDQQRPVRVDGLAVQARHADGTKPALLGRGQRRHRLHRCALDRGPQRAGAGVPDRRRGLGGQPDGQLPRRYLGGQGRVLRRARGRVRGTQGPGAGHLRDRPPPAQRPAEEHPRGAVVRDILLELQLHEDAAGRASEPVSRPSSAACVRDDGGQACDRGRHPSAGGADRTGADPAGLDRRL